MPSIFVQSLTPKLRRLLSTDVRARSAVEALTPEELTALTAAARSDREATDGLASHRAIGLLALAARPEAAVPVLVAIAQDRSARATNRVAALNGLAQLASPDAQRTETHYGEHAYTKRLDVRRTLLARPLPAETVL